MASRGFGPDYRLNNTVTISAYHQEPFFKTEARGDGSLIYSGFFPDLIKEIAEKVKFEYKFVISEGDEPGYKNGDGTFTGVIADLIHRRADIGGLVKELSTYERVVELSPVMSSGLSVLAKRPEVTDNSIDFLFRPFAFEYWILLAISLVVVSSLFALVSRFSPYEKETNSDSRDRRATTGNDQFTPAHSILFVFSTFSWQGYNRSPKSVSGKILAICWWMFVLMSLLAYTASLTALFLNKSWDVTNPAYTTLEEVTSHYPKVLPLIEERSTEYQIILPKTKKYRQFYDLMNSDSRTLVQNYIEGVQKVRNSTGDKVLVLESNTADWLVQNDCKLTAERNDFFDTNFAIATPINSIYKNVLYLAILQLKESGVLKELIDKYWRNTTISACSNKLHRRSEGFRTDMIGKEGLEPVSLNDMLVAVVALVFGVGLALIALLCEIIFFSTFRKKTGQDI